jgi:hypothetical protein
MKNVEALYESYKKNNHPFAEIILTVLNNSNNPDYLIDNLNVLMISIERDKKAIIPVIIENEISF